MAAAIVCVSDSRRIGPASFCVSIKGKLNRMVAMPIFARESASVSINEWSIHSRPRSMCQREDAYVGLSGKIYIWLKLCLPKGRLLF